MNHTFMKKNFLCIMNPKDLQIGKIYIQSNWAPITTNRTKIPMEAPTHTGLATPSSSRSSMGYYYFIGNGWDYGEQARLIAPVWWEKAQPHYGKSPSFSSA